MIQYIKALKYIRENGEKSTNRTGVDTIGVFADPNTSMIFDLTGYSLPLLTTKKVAYKSMIRELLWFLKGDTNIRYLNESGVHIWDEWADSLGNLGPIYGKQWRKWKDVKIVKKEDGIGNIKYMRYKATFSNGDNIVLEKEIDQIRILEEQLKSLSDSRRLILSAWNVSDLDDMALQPCHLLCQFRIVKLTQKQKQTIFEKTGKVPVSDFGLKAVLFQRSADFFLGVPFNIASYGLLTHMLAKIARIEPVSLTTHFGDAHIYENHISVVEEQLKRNILENTAKVNLNTIQPDGNKKTSITQIEYEDISIVDYLCHTSLKAEVAV